MRRKTDKWVIGCTVLCFLCLMLSAVVSGTVLDTSVRAKTAQDTAEQIQRERAANILRSCREVNQRNDDTIAAIDRLTLERLTGKPVAATSPNPIVTARLAEVLAALPGPERKQVEQTRKSTAVIIDALAPKRSCEALVALQAPSAASPTPTK